jgi:hypothetical protein
LIANFGVHGNAPLPWTCCDVRFSNRPGWVKRFQTIHRCSVDGQATRASKSGWRTFLRNHAPDIAAMDLFVVPTIGFDLLYAFVIVRLDRRDLVWINVTTSPTALHAS